MKIGEPIILPDGTYGVVDKITSGIVEVIPFWRARPYPRVVVLGLDRGFEDLGEEDEL